MKRGEFIEFLIQNGCVIVREANQGYTVMRNILNAEISGVPSDEVTLPATICRICKTLEIDPPSEAKAAQSIIDFAHRNHGNKES